LVGLLLYDRHMRTGPPIAQIASLIGDPARANILTALMSGKALTASELAREAGVTAQTTSGHLSKLRDGGLILGVQQGRHRYFRLAGAEIAELLEGLMDVAVRAVRPVRTGPRDEAMRAARVCYDHLAGAAGVRLVDVMLSRGWLVDTGGNLAVTEAGEAWLASFGLDMAALRRQRRPLCRACLDWSERRTHLGGALGAALFAAMESKAWLRRVGVSRAICVTPLGDLELRRLAAEPLPRQHGSST
jgi:DNA-binding transcriptional ArsR family regulator